MNLIYSTFTEKDIKAQPKAVTLFYQNLIDEQHKIMDKIEVATDFKMKLNSVDIFKILSNDENFIYWLRDEIRNMDKESDLNANHYLKNKLENVPVQIFDHTKSSLSARIYYYWLDKNWQPVRMQLNSLSEIAEFNKEQINKIRAIHKKCKEIKDEFYKIIFPIIDDNKMQLNLMSYLYYTGEI